MYFVTGATGFLGKPLTARLLASGQPVRCLRHLGSSRSLPAGIQGLEADLADSGALTAGLHGCHTVFHFAGKAHDLGSTDASEFIRVNVEGTGSLLRAAREAGVRTFLFLSSVKAMGEGGDECLDEDAPAAPRTPYGISKLEAENLILEAGLKTGMHVTILRLPLAYGPGLRGNLCAMLDAVKRGTFPPPPRVRNRRSLVSTEDVVNASLLGANDSRASGRTYLVTDGRAYSTRDIYDAMRAALHLAERNWAVPRWAFRGAALGGDLASHFTGRRMPFSTEVFDKFLGSSCYRNDRIRRELGFTPATDLESALPEIVKARVLTS